MRREFLRLAWRTLTTWRRSTPDPPTEHPGEDRQFSEWLRDRNLQDRADEDESEWKP